MSRSSTPSLPVVCPLPRSHQHRFFCRAILRLISLSVPTSTVRTSLLIPFYVSCRSRVGVAHALKNLKKVLDPGLTFRGGQCPRCWRLGGSEGVFIVFQEHFTYFYLICMNILPAMSACAPHARSALGGQRRASEPLEQELQVVVSSRVGAEN